MAFDSCLVVYFDSYGGYVCSYQHLSRRGNGPLVTWTLVSEKKIWGAEVIHGKVQEIHASKGRYSIRVQMPDKELVQEFRGGVGTRGPSFMPFKRSIKNDDWAVEKQACKMFCSLYIFRNKDQMMIPRDISRVWLWFMAKAARRLKVRAHPHYLAGSVNEATSPRDWFGYVRFTRSWWSLDLYKPFDVENRLKRISLMFVLLMSIQRYPPKKFADGRMLIWMIEFDETVISSLQLLFPMTSLKFPPLI